MKLRDKIAAVLSASLLAVTAWAMPAYAGGSDDPTPYTVDEDGITLNGGDTFPDNGHVNITVDVEGVIKQLNLHFESLNQAPDSPKSYYIGKSFLPWSAFGLEGSFCVIWVQISLYNEHLGEGANPGVCVGLEGQCPVGYEKPESGWDSSSQEWTADKDYSIVILVGGPPNSNNDDPDGRFKYFYDVASGETVARVAHDISHLCLLPAPQDEEDPLFICEWNGEQSVRTEVDEIGEGDIPWTEQGCAPQTQDPDPQDEELLYVCEWNGTLSEKVLVEEIGEDDVPWTEDGCEPEGGVSDNPPQDNALFICEWDAESEKSVKTRVDEIGEDDIEWTNEGCAPEVETVVLSDGPPIPVAVPSYTG